MTRPPVEYPFAMDVLFGPDDFRPEWDVPSLGKEFTDALSRDIDDMRSHPGLKSERKMHLFAGQAGYGKTHLFGRVRHRQGEQVQFVFIPAPRTTTDIHAIAVWPLIETLFASKDGFAPIRVHLSRLLAPSFAAYFDQLSPALKAKLTGVVADMKSDPLTALQVCAGVSELVFYRKLAEAVLAQAPGGRGLVLRALVLALSPAADDARWWLRGEAELVPEDRLAALGLPPSSPPAGDVIQGVAELLRGMNTPLVLCFDQLELLFEKDNQAFRALTTHLMEWLQTIPNLVLTLGCYEDVWKRLKESDAYKAFLDRVAEHALQPLSPDQAVEFIERRMKSWVEYKPGQAAGWPFDLDSVRRYVGKNEPSPRYFTKEQCRNRFDDWLAKKRPGPITLDKAGSVQSPSVAFVQEWTQQLEAVKKERKNPIDTQEAELWEGVEEALHVADIGKHTPDGVTVTRIERQLLKATKDNQRPSAKLVLARAGMGYEIAITLSKNTGGTPFGHWMTALDGALKGKVVGALAVWPALPLTVSKTTEGYKKYKARLDGGLLREFSLADNAETFAQLECLRRMVRDADAKALLLGTVAISADECRKLVAETGVIAKLKLFEFLFENWPAFTAAAPVVVAAPPPSLPPPVVAKSPVVPPPAIAKPPQPPARFFDKPPEPVVPPAPTVHVPAAPEPTWAEGILKKAAEYLRKKGQPVHPVGAEVGPTFVRLKVELRGDADFAKVRKQSENLKLHLALADEPLIASRAGYVSIDVQRPDRQTVFLPPLLAACPPQLAGEPAFPAGVDVAGRVEWLNLSEPESCHLLVAGTTGSGKSEFLKAMLAGLAARLGPEKVRFRLIDPKRVTFNIDPKCPCLGGPVVYDGEEAIPVLEECFDEMERRYELLQRRGKDHVRDLTGTDAVARWVVVFDEFADLMLDTTTKKQLEPLLKRLGAKARAAGIHLVLGTQRPEASVVTPLLRSNLPGRIGLQVATERESKLFLDMPDAAYLFGKGDLVWKRGGGLTRLQSPFVPKAEFDAYLRAGRH